VRATPTHAPRAFVAPAEQIIRARADDPAGTPPHMRSRTVWRADTAIDRSSRLEREMSRSSCYSLALLAALTVTSGAYPGANHNHPSIQPGAHASVAGTSETDIRKQCAEEARALGHHQSGYAEEPRLRRHHLPVRSRRAQSISHRWTTCPGRPR